MKKDFNHLVRDDDGGGVEVLAVHARKAQRSHRVDRDVEAAGRRQIEDVGGVVAHRRAAQAKARARLEV